ncbi:hypothetical protein C0Q70_06959 [Pomacea canaliculata]|uniref:Sushi domain-containing protein n=1 Tax=Pomacea canaliculata TaxID=400727 RepID=A0A2T7PDQ3_POMCA|nr:hypothetical protein C0Q70_06959 [Pomacea canaliculata]
MFCLHVADCEVLQATQYSYVTSRNSTVTEYGCKEGYRHLSGDLIRYCFNSTWTGEAPACTVDSVLPKAYLVMLIIGATLSVFVACIPYDFYRYRKRKKAVRKHQERLSLMTRIAPGHAKMMTEIVPAEQRLPAGQRRFGFRSLIKAFRFVADKMKTTNGDEALGCGGVDGDTTTSSNNGGLSTGGAYEGGGPKSPRSPLVAAASSSSPNPNESCKAQERMSAVIRLWTGGRGFPARARSLDATDDHLPLFPNKRNSLASNNNPSAISTAATSAATAAAAATAGSALSVDNPNRRPSVVEEFPAAEEEERERATDIDHVVDMRGVAIAAADGCESGNEEAGMGPETAVGPPPRALRIPKSSSARFVQLTASIPLHRDQREDGACVGGKFKVKQRSSTGGLYDGSLSSPSSSSLWQERGLRPSVSADPNNRVAALTEVNVAAFNDERFEGESEGKAPELVSPEPMIISPQVSSPSSQGTTSQDSGGKKWCKRMSTTSSATTDEADISSWDGGPTRADVH